MIRVTKKVLQLLSVKQKRALAGMGVMILVGALLESLGVSLILPLLEAIMDESEWNSTWYSNIICSIFNIHTYEAYTKVLLLLLIAVYIIKNVYLLFEYYMQYSFIAQNRRSMQKQLMCRFINKPYAFYLTSSSGEIVRIISNDTQMTTTLLINLLQYYMELIISVVLAVTIFLINPMMATVVAVVLLIELYFIAYIVKPRVRKLGKKLIKERALVNRWILQAVNGIKSIRVASTEYFFEEQYDVHSLGVAESERKNQTLNKMPQLFIEAVTVTAVLCIVLLMLASGIKVASVIPALSAFVIAAVRLLPSANKITVGMNGVIYNEAALDSVLEHLSEDLGNTAFAIQEKKGTRIVFDNNVRLDNIVFSYSNDVEPVLKNANMVIYKGQSVGIIGVSGSGKTTAIDIMLGLLKPQSGQVLVDGVNIEENLRSWRGCLAYIPQQIFLMDDSIKANVAFGKRKLEIDEEQVWNALREAQLESFVKTLPDGIETSIGEAGIRLSGGQRQRIGIARALYNNPEILFFDEATSALDGKTENAIMESINQLKGSKTLVIIAHRLTTIEKCDVIYRVENGGIIREENVE